MMKILYFGRLSDRAGRREASIALPDDVNDIDALKAWLDAEHSLNGALDDASIKVMINQELTNDKLTLTGTEEIGFLPPVGGG